MNRRINDLCNWDHEWEFQETCDARFDVHGQINTGTNLMVKLIEKNCPVNNTAQFRIHVNWWKHAPLCASQLLQSDPTDGDRVHFVVVKDPFTWFRSVCMNDYDLIRMLPGT